MTQCPRLYVPPDVWEAMEAAALYEKGIPPVAGGQLDQAELFLAFYRFWQSERDTWKAQLGYT